MDNDALLCNCTFWPPRNRLPRGDWLGGWGRPRSSGRSWRWPPRRGWRECPAAPASGGQSSEADQWSAHGIPGVLVLAPCGGLLARRELARAFPFYQFLIQTHIINVFVIWINIFDGWYSCILFVFVFQMYWLCSLWFYSTHILKVCLNVAGQHCRFKVPYGQRLSFLHLH